MQCYQHQDQSAVGLCKACQKAVCSRCVRDTGRGLACSDACEAEVGAINEIIERSKSIYGIGSTSRLPATGVMLNLFMAVLFIAWGLYPLAKGRMAEWFLVAFGAGFLVFGILSYVRTRKLRLNC